MAGVGERCGVSGDVVRAVTVHHRLVRTTGVRSRRVEPFEGAAATVLLMCSDRAEMPGANPLLDAWVDAVANGRDPQARDELVRRYSFAVPDERALDAIRGLSARGLIEVGAGTGYWARLLAERGVDVVAVDVAPAPSSRNTWFAGTAAWWDVEMGDESRVDDHGDRTLLLVWPTRNETWPADAVVRFAAAGGQRFVRVGEGPGGRTGDDQFHSLVGDLDRCWSCAYGVTDTACVCGVTPLFESVETIEIPRWHGFQDDLRIYRRTTERRALSPRPERARRWGKGRRR